MSSLYILCNNPFNTYIICKHFSHSVSGLFHSVDSFPFVQKRFGLPQSHLFIFAFVAQPEEADPRPTLLRTSTSSMVLGLKRLGL